MKAEVFIKMLTFDDKGVGGGGSKKPQNLLT